MILMFSLRSAWAMIKTRAALDNQLDAHLADLKAKPE
jgi:hypothetical protein